MIALLLFFVRGSVCLVAVWHFVVSFDFGGGFACCFAMGGLVLADKALVASRLRQKGIRILFVTS